MRHQLRHRIDRADLDPCTDAGDRRLQMLRETRRIVAAADDEILEHARAARKWRLPVFEVIRGGGYEVEAERPYIFDDPDDAPALALGYLPGAHVGFERSVAAAHAGFDIWREFAVHGPKCQDLEPVSKRRLAGPQLLSQCPADEGDRLGGWPIRLGEFPALEEPRPHSPKIAMADDPARGPRSEEHTSELQSPDHLVCRLLLEKKKR